MGIFCGDNLGEVVVIQSVIVYNDNVVVGDSAEAIEDMYDHRLAVDGDKGFWRAETGESRAFAAKRNENIDWFHDKCLK